MASLTKEKRMDKLESLIEKLLDKKLEPIVKTLDTLKSKINKLDFIEQSITFLSQQYDDLTKKIKNLESENKLLKQENTIIKTEMHRSTNSLAQLKQEINNMEQYSQRECLEIRSIQVTEGENTNDLVKKVGRLIHVQINDKVTVFQHLGI